MPTIRDVAVRAGVAPITVSRVLNNSAPVNAETRARIEAAIAALNYVPNSLARSLRFKGTRLIALILVDIINPFWATIARGVEDAANAHGFHVMLCNVDESAAKQNDYITVALQKQADGVIILPLPEGYQNLARITSQGVPLVGLDCPVPGMALDLVRADSRAGAYELVRYLIELGHRDIAMLSGPSDYFTAGQRIEAYCQALQEAGLASSISIYEDEYNMTGGERSLRRLLAERPLPSALFAANNFIAIGAITVLRAAGYRVPDDVSLACIDDLPLGAAIDPFLTCAAQPAYEIGRQAAELLVKRMAGVLPPEPVEIVLPVSLIKRRSCRPVAA